jgi:hypothetical protein
MPVGRRWWIPICGQDRSKQLTFGFISPKKYSHRARVLRNLSISEVSSVDAGAGHGVRVKLLKRDSSTPVSKVWDGIGTEPGYDRGFFYTKGQSTMPTMQEKIAKSHHAAVTGQISFAKAASEQMDRALEMFPTAKSRGEAMAKYLGTEVGRRDVQNLKDLEFLKSQWDNRIGDGATAVLKHGGDGFPEVHLDASQSGAVDSDQDDGEREEPWDKRVQALMDKLGCTKDQAISHLHRMEKVSKGI